MARCRDGGWISYAALVLLAMPLAPVACSGQTQVSGLAHFRVTVIPAGGDPDAIAVADINHDGKPDLIVANPQSGTVTVLLGDGEGHFHSSPGSPFQAGHLPSDVGIGDFNGDGHADLLIPNHQTPNVTLLLGDGKGGFLGAPHSPFATNAKPHPHGVTVGHFCGAQEPLDAVIDSWGTGQVELLIGDGHGELRNGGMFAAGAGSDKPLRSADLNGDGVPDVVMPDTAIGQWNSDRVSVLLGDGRCGFHAAPGSPFAGGAVPWSMAIGDLNGDGTPDVVLVPYGAQVQDPRAIAATILLGDGRGGLHPMAGSPFPLPGCASPRSVAIGSVAGRGRDFAVTCSNSARVLLFRGQDRFRVSALDLPHGSAGAQSETRGVAMADLTGAGRDDLIFSNGSEGTITVLHWKD